MEVNGHYLLSLASIWFIANHLIVFIIGPLKVYCPNMVFMRLQFTPEERKLSLTDYCVFTVFNTI